MQCFCIVDGVELLCLINKHLDACKYYMSFGMWQEAVWLAKVWCLFCGHTNVMQCKKLHVYLSHVISEDRDQLLCLCNLTNVFAEHSVARQGSNVFSDAYLEKPV